MLHILAELRAARRTTLDRVMEFGGPGLRVALARRARHARQHGDRVLGQGGRRRGRRGDARSGSPRAGPGADVDALRARTVVRPTRARTTRAASTRSTSSAIRPMVATPGDPAQRHPLRPDERRAASPTCGEVPIDIAYGGSCTAGKEDDLDLYAG